MNEEQLEECAAAFDYEYGDGAWVDPNLVRDRLIFGTAWIHAVSETKAFATANMELRRLPSGSPATERSEP